MRGQSSRVEDEAPKITLQGSERLEVSEAKALARVTGSCVKRPSISKLIQGSHRTPMSEIEGQKSQNSELRITRPGSKGQKSGILLLRAQRRG